MIIENLRRFTMIAENLRRFGMIEKDFGRFEMIAEYIFLGSQVSKPINRVLMAKGFLILSCDKFVLDESGSSLVDRRLLFLEKKKHLRNT